MAHKIAFIFLIIFSLASFSQGFFIQNLLGGLSGGSIDISKMTDGSFGEDNNIQAQLEFHTTVVESLFDTLGTLIQTKTNLLLWLKKTFVLYVIRGLAYLRFFMLHNAEFVHNLINIFAELLKLILTNKPHFAVPHITKIVQQAMNADLPYSN